MKMLAHISFRSPHLLARQSGRSIIEVMIAVTIGLIVLTATIGAFIATQSTSRQTSGIARLTQDGSYALELIGQKIRSAGFGEIKSSIAGAAFARRLSLMTLHGCDGAYDQGGAALPGAAFTAPGTATPCAAPILINGMGSDAIAMSETVEPSNCPPGGTTPPPVASAVTFQAPFGADVLGQCVHAQELPNGIALSQVTHRFYVATSPSTGRAALYVASTSQLRPPNFTFYAGVVPSAGTAPLIDGVEQLRIMYLVSNQNTGEGTQYMNATAVAAGDPDINLADYWARVVGVRVCVLVSTEDVAIAQAVAGAAGGAAPTAGQNAFTDCDGVRRGAADTRLRRTSTGLYLMRNRATAISHNRT